MLIAVQYYSTSLGVPTREAGGGIHIFIKYDSKTVEVVSVIVDCTTTVLMTVLHKNGMNSSPIRRRAKQELV
jgi:hypothetical protein